MKTYTLTSFVSASQFGRKNKDGSLKPDPYSKPLLDAAVKSGEPVGPMEIIVSFGAKSVDNSEQGYTITGNAIAAEREDLSDTTEIDERIARDLGTIGSVDSDDPFKDELKSGQLVSLWYAMNHGGLPLQYGNEHKNTFKEKKGRQNVAVAVASFKDEVRLAMQWAASAQKYDIMADVDTLLAAFRAK